MRAFLFSLLRFCWNIPRRFYFYSARFSLKRSSAAEPVLSFGEVLDRQTHPHGGAVKLLTLKRSFLTNQREFNILYLVSSAQPPFALDLLARARQRGIAFVWNQNGVAYRAWAAQDVELHNAPMRLLHQMADYVIYQSAFSRDCAQHFLGASQAPSQILFNPIDLDVFAPLPVRPPLQPLRLLTLGTHGYRARVLSTLACLKCLQEAGTPALLTLAGQCQWPNAHRELQEEIASLGLQSLVTLLPAFTQAQAVTLYQSHHLLLHPKYLDPSPTVVLEALSSGCPVVGSATGGLPELVSKESGVLIPAALQWDQMITPTGEELAAGVLKILPHFSSYAQAARQRAELLFNKEEWIAGHRAIFAACLSRKI